MIEIEFNKEDLIKSPLNYTGSKYRLLKKGMLEYFPNKIDTFYDLFGEQVMFLSMLKQIMLYIMIT